MKGSGCGLQLPVQQLCLLFLHHPKDFSSSRIFPFNFTFASFRRERWGPNIYPPQLYSHWSSNISLGIKGQYSVPVAFYQPILDLFTASSWFYCSLTSALFFQKQSNFNCPLHVYKKPAVTVGRRCSEWSELQSLVSKQYAQYTQPTSPSLEVKTQWTQHIHSFSMWDKWSRIAGEAGLTDITRGSILTSNRTSEASLNRDEMSSKLKQQILFPFS